MAIEMKDFGGTPLGKRGKLSYLTEEWLSASNIHSISHVKLLTRPL